MSRAVFMLETSSDDFWLSPWHTPGNWSETWTANKHPWRVDDRFRVGVLLVVMEMTFVRLGSLHRDSYRGRRSRALQRSSSPSSFVRATPLRSLERRLQANMNSVGFRLCRRNTLAPCVFLALRATRNPIAPRECFLCMRSAV